MKIFSGIAVVFIFQINNLKKEQDCGIDLYIPTFT